MMNTNKNLLMAAAVGVVVLGGIIWLLYLLIGGSGGDGLGGNGRGVEGEPIDVTLDFYEDWLAARNATSTDPIAKGLHNSPVLSEEMSSRLAEYEGRFDELEVDPVICQSTMPGALRSNPIYQNDTGAQILIIAASLDMPGQATVTLAGENGVWMITDIKCSSGEEDPNQGEFSFDKEGYLLKSVPEPLDSQYWHIVYEQDGVFGHAVPLFLGAESTCIQTDGTEATCSTDMFAETESVRVQGQMTEAGLDVKRIEFRE